MKPSIIITRHPYEEPYCIRLEVDASNDCVRGHLEIYTSPELLMELGETIATFPRQVPDNHCWELGSEHAEEQNAYYFRFELFTRDKSGHSGIHIRLNNNCSFPDREVSEFSIVALPADLDRLGRLLREFAKLEHEVMKWTVSSGKLYRTLAEFEEAMQSNES